MEQRPIKIKAWDTFKKEWHSFDPAGFTVDETPTIFEFLDGRKELIFVQFTGLHDKHGNEIYERDILKHINQYGGKPYLVEWRDGCFNISEKEDDLSICAEIIGNIYENPELLK